MGYGFIIFFFRKLDQRYMYKQGVSRFPLSISHLDCINLHGIPVYVSIEWLYFIRKYSNHTWHDLYTMLTISSSHEWHQHGTIKYEPTRAVTWSTMTPAPGSLKILPHPPGTCYFFRFLTNIMFHVRSRWKNKEIIWFRSIRNEMIKKQFLSISWHRIVLLVTFDPKNLDGLSLCCLQTELLISSELRNINWPIKVRVVLFAYWDIFVLYFVDCGRLFDGLVWPNYFWSTFLSADYSME